jgi:hypothetical protein
VAEVYISFVRSRSSLPHGRDEDLTTYRLKGGMVSETSISAMAGAMRAGSLVD